MKFIHTYNNLRETFLTDTEDWLLSQFPDSAAAGVLDWDKFRQIAVACDEGHVHNLPSRFPDLACSTLERAAELLCPNGFYY
ncbi:MAG: hypothetical protein [Leptochloa chinensis fiers-like virus 1]|nr:MAG: hypothetical protein [Leptochloa chinensis fiers-like virus 1]UUW21215.1 MAG: hypothetical protein [Leptochloa chinensis fiers-like virus 1]UUW21219.1 MAG: hypothetical protein [Leptochloa chinensis fiers-like virus 1]UUW21223.1 MAG: hypothetical protein [Leptochloa chinensis fiers-like virus 1]